MRRFLLYSVSMAMAVAIALFDVAPSEGAQLRLFLDKSDRTKGVTQPRARLVQFGRPRFRRSQKKVITNKPFTTKQLRRRARPGLRRSQKKLFTNKQFTKKRLRRAKPHLKGTNRKKLFTNKPFIKKRLRRAKPHLKGTNRKKLLTTKPLMKPLIRKGAAHLKFGKVKLRRLPIFRSASGTATLRGRLGPPKNLTPKFTLTQAPKPIFRHRMAPFVQRHWKKAFVWVAVAGLGYMTIPESYYDQFLGYISEDDPNYEACIELLSLAAVEEEEEIVRVRKPMPANADYRYSAKAAPGAAGGSESACSLEPFVERTWSRPFAWVQIPEVGNITVPEDYYNRFVGFASAEPVDYPAACKVLVEAAAMDTVTMATSYRKRQFQ